MTLIVADRVMETSTTTGNGAITLAGAVNGYRAFSAVCTNGDTVPYYAEDVNGTGTPTGAWETGIGTWSTGNILTRAVVYQSSAGAGTPATWAVGTRRVGLGMLAETLFTNDDSLKFSIALG